MTVIHPDDVDKSKLSEEQAKTLERIKKLTLNNERIKEAASKLDTPTKHR